MEAMFETHRHVYNNALAERRNAWEERQESVSYEDQSASYKRAWTGLSGANVEVVSSCVS
jgi:hypothetical protein